MTDAAQTTAFLARTSGLSAQETANYKALVNGLVSDGIWSLFDAIYAFKTKDTANAALNLVGTSFSLLTIGSPVFTADQSYTGAASSALNTQFDTTATGHQFTRDSGSVWAWTTTNFASGVDYGSMLGNGGNSTRIYPHYSNNLFYSSVNCALASVSPTAPGHLYGQSRSAAGVWTAYVDTTAYAQTSASSAPSGTIVLLADSSAGLNPFTGNLAFVAIGGNLTSAQQAMLYARVSAFIAGAVIVAAPGTMASIANIAALRLLDASFTGNYVDVVGYYDAAAGALPIGGGPFVYVPGDTTSADNGATIFTDAVTPTARRWYRVGAQPLALADIGCKQDGSDSATLLAALATLPNPSKTIRLSPGTTYSASPVSLPANTRWEGAPGTTLLTLPAGANSEGIQINDGVQLIGGNYQSNDVGFAFKANAKDVLIFNTSLAVLGANPANGIAYHWNSPGQKNVNVFLSKIASPHYGLLTNTGADITGMKVCFNDLVTGWDALNFNSPALEQKFIVAMGNTLASSGAYTIAVARTRYGAYIGNVSSLAASEGIHFEDLQYGNTLVGSVFANNQFGLRASNNTGGVAASGSRALPVVANNFQGNQNTNAVTFSIASPGVVTDVAHAFTGPIASGNFAHVKFTTTGTLPTGLVAGKTYFVVPASVTTDTYQVAATAGGAAINFTRTQSGVHTRQRVSAYGIYNVYDGAGTLGFMGYASNYVYGYDEYGLHAGSVAHTISDNNVFDTCFRGVASSGGSINGTNFFKNIKDAWAEAKANSVEFGRLVGDSVPVQLLETTGRVGVGSVIRNGFEWPLSATVNAATTAIPFVQMPTLMFGRIIVRAGGNSSNFGYYAANIKYDPVAGVTVDPASVSYKPNGTFAVASPAFSIVPAAAPGTFTIAAPGVISDPGHCLPANSPVVFTTSGALPIGITSGTTYYISATGLTNDTYQVSAYPGGPSITTTGTQSGTHTRTANSARLAFNCTRSDGPATQAFTFDYAGEYYKE
jgi:hypothetical protein